MILGKKTVGMLVAAALVLGSAGCTAVAHNSVPSTSPSAVVTASPVATPSATLTAPTTFAIGNVPLATRPAWKADADQRMFAHDMLRYLQTLARAAKVPLPTEGLSMAYVLTGVVVECDRTRTPSTINGSNGQPYAIMWCPTLKTIVAAPDAIGKLDAKQVEHLNLIAMSFFAHAVAANAAEGHWLGQNEASCYTGVLMRAEVTAGRHTNIEAFKLLRDHYEGGTSNWVYGFASGTCAEAK